MAQSILPVGSFLPPTCTAGTLACSVFAALPIQVIAAAHLDPFQQEVCAGAILPLYGPPPAADEGCREAGRTCGDSPHLNLLANHSGISLGSPSLSKRASCRSIVIAPHSSIASRILTRAPMLARFHFLAIAA